MEQLFSFGFLALPTVFISLSLLGALLALAWRRFGLGLALASSLCLFVAATPAASSFLLRRLETAVPAHPDLAAAQAIVVLGGDIRTGGAEVPDTLGPLSLERVVFAVEAYRQLHLPVFVTGGREADGHEAVGVLMAAALRSDFGVPVAAVEDRSRSTWENAVYTAQLLRPRGVATVVLVSHAWHLPRALWSFERAGLKALPWPAPRASLRLDRPGDFLPRIRALVDSFDALHELIGGLYYRLRYR